MHLFTQAWFGGASMAYQLIFYTVIAQKEEAKGMRLVAQRLLVM